MVTEAGDNVSDEITLTNRTSKGGRGRTILMRPAVREAPVALKTARIDKVRTRLSAIHAERGRGTSGASATVWSDRPYSGLGLTGFSSHCGRWTIITRPAQEIVEMGGSLRDVQQLAGHTNIRTTRPAIEGNPKPRSKVFALI
jgi:integrase/recombinase XerD